MKIVTDKYASINHALYTYVYIDKMNNKTLAQIPSIFVYLLCMCKKKWDNKLTRENKTISEQIHKIIIVVTSAIFVAIYTRNWLITRVKMMWMCINNKTNRKLLALSAV